MSDRLFGASMNRWMEHEQSRWLAFLPATIIVAVGALAVREARNPGATSHRVFLAVLIGGAILATLVSVAVFNAMRRHARRLLDHNAVLQEQAIELEQQSAELESQTSDLESQAADLESHTHDLQEIATNLSHSEARYRALVEGLAEGVLLELSDGRIVAANSSAERILGMSAQAIMQRTGVDAGWHAVHEDGTPFLPEERPYVLALREGRPRRDEILGVNRADGTRVWLRVNSQPLFREGEDKPYGVVTSFSDITQQRQLFEQLLQAQKMEAVGQLAGGVAHDFNNVLTVILSYGELLRSEFADDDPRRDDIDQIVRSARRGASLTRQLLAFSRRQVLQPRIMQVNDVVAEMQEMLARLLGETVKLETRLDPDTRTIRADPGQIEQILMNLAVNARDAMPDGGVLRISTENVSEPDANGDTDVRTYVLLCVSDTGAGMDDATQRKIFEPFFTTKEKGKGTGLGLSTVYGIIQQAGGRVEVQSAVGKGTTFRLWFPAERTRAGLVSPTSWKATTDGHETVLVAEDEDAIRELLARLLTQYGFKVITAKNGHEALRAARAHSGPIHLLLTDVIMPDMSGAALVADVRRELPGIRVLYVSGYTHGELGRYSIGEGADFVQKPFAADELISKVRTVLGAPSASRAEAS